MTLITVASAERPLNKRVTPFSAHGSARPSMANQVNLNDTNDPASLDMVAACATPEDAAAFALVNDSASNNKPLTPLSANAQTTTTDLHWNGSDESLRGWVLEFQSTISIRAPHLHTLIVESIVHENGRVIIFCLGQAAQLEGDMPRPAYSYENPAPIDADSYPVSREAIEAAYHRLHRRALARNPSMTTALAAIPADAVYPIDANDYRVSATLLKNYNNQLRNHILSTIVDVATRTMLGDKYPTDGRALLQHLRTRAEQPLKTSQVNSIMAQIDYLVNTGINCSKSPTRIILM